MRDCMIKVDNLRDGKVITLLLEHRKEMYEYSPPESIHALEESELKEPAITFWSAWQNEEIIGCGALKELSPEHAEIKSMRTAKAFLREGVANMILTTMLAAGKKRDYRRISLETGTNEAFQPAVRLYRKYGFEECGPFAEYKKDPYSLFMTREI
ncbi:GNAT family N-acetyltransferase [Kangiella shandongensis]|uniref:GNAT family N-acetyltransferase n=1 Tax=Kangiella shandongensis TaxID=2763258 RepID=UPI001CBFED34|nr:GNAT family N-acetyltransferase [Kangiella shandongensis]